MVARVDGAAITVADVQARIAEQPPYARARYASPERRRELIDELVRVELQHAEAMRRGLDADPAVIAATRQILVQRLVNDAVAEAARRDITDDELRAYYDTHRAEFHSPAEVRISAIRMRDAVTAAKVASLARGADAKRFRELAEQYTLDEEARARGGDLGYFALTSSALPAEVIAAAFALEKSFDVSAPIASASGHYVVSQTGKRPAVARSFDEVRSDLHARLAGERRARAVEDMIAGLRAKAEVIVDEAALSRVRAP